MLNHKLNDEKADIRVSRDVRLEVWQNKTRQGGRIRKGAVKGLIHQPTTCVRLHDVGMEVPRCGKQH